MYQLNKAYVADKLCENKAKPEMQCKGKCYLKKQLKKTGDKEQNGNSSQSESFQFASCTVPPIGWQQVVYQPEPVYLKHYSRYTSFAGINNYKDIFHPPQARC